MAALTLASDGTLTLTAWTRTDTNQPLTAGTVTWQVYGPTGAAVSGASGTLTHTAGGTYTGVVESSTFTSADGGADGLLIEGQAYRIAVTCVQSGINREFNLFGYVQRAGAS